MLQVIQSPFLQALGYAIINSLWQFALLWLIYVSLHTIFKLSSHQKYVTGLLIQLSGFAWFSVTFFSYLRKFIQLEEIYFLQQKPIALAFNIGKSWSLRDSILKGIQQTDVLLPYLSIAYLAILLILCFRWMRAYKITYAVKNTGLHEIDTDWKLFVKRLSRQLGIKREVKIHLSEMIASPLTIGFLKPVILVPIASLNHLNSYQMEAVILHELAHIKRFDYLYNVLLACVDITLFFNPFAVLISKYVKRERENCCDDWVLQYEYNPALYASALLQIAVCQTKTSLLTMQAADNRNVLLTRIKRMIEKNEKTFFNYRYQLLALFVMLSVVTSLALLSSWHNLKKNASSSVTRQVVSAPMAEIVNNPLYNPEFLIGTEEQKNADIKKPSERIPKKDGFFNTSVYKTATTASNVLKPPVENMRQPKVAASDKKTILAKKVLKSSVSLGHDWPSFDTKSVTDEALDAGLFEAATLKENHFELAEHQFKELARNFNISGEPVIDATEIAAQIKTALEQIKNIKTRVDERKFLKMSKERRERFKAVREKSRESFNHREMELAVRDLQLQALKFEEQRKKLAKLGFQFHVDGNMAETRFVPAPVENHTFSFEISTQPKVREIVPATPIKINTRVKKAEAHHETRDLRINLNRNEGCPSVIGAEAKPNVVVIKI